MADLPRAEKPDEVTDKLINIPLLGFIFKRLRLMSNGRNDEATVREHIEELIEEVDDDSKQIGADQGELIVNILKLHELTAEDVMVPRADIVAADVNCKFDDLVNLMAEDSHSRVPVYREQLDNVTGFVHIKDVLVAVHSKRTRQSLALVFFSESAQRDKEAFGRYQDSVNQQHGENGIR